MSRLSGGYTGPLIVNATFEADSFQPYALAVDESEQWVFWSNVHEGKIQRINHSGKFARDVVSDGVMRCFGMVVHDDHVFYTDANKNAVMKVHTSGDYLPEFVVGGLDYPRGLAIHGDYMYATEFKGRIVKARTDGGNLERNPTKAARHVEIVLELSSQVRLDGLSIGEIDGKQQLIWTEMNLNRISAATLYGMDPTVVTTGLIWPRHITHISGSIYFSEFLGRVRTTSLSTLVTTGLVDSTGSAASQEIMRQVEVAQQERGAIGSQQIFFAIEEF
jgi:hypothetical protein